MKYYWKNGFYIDEINFDIDPDSGTYIIPDGYVEITEEQWRMLLKGQATGKRIIIGDSGIPELADRLPTKPNPIAEASKLLQAMQVRAAALAIPAADDAAAFTLAPLCKTWTAGTHYDALEIVNHEGRTGWFRRWIRWNTRCRVRRGCWRSTGPSTRLRARTKNPKRSTSAWM